MRPFASLVLCCLLVICSPLALARACTSFCLDGPDGPIYVTNLDLNTGEGHIFVNRRGIAKEGCRTSTTGETAKWVSRYGSVTFNVVGRELPWGGMNEAGLVMSLMQLNASKCPDPDERPPLSEASLLQYILDTCASVQEAIQAASVVRLAQNECANHYLVADETGDCAAFEFLDGRFVCYNGETLPVKALANAPYAAGITFIEKGVVPADNPGASVERVAAAAYKMEAYDPDGGVSPIDYSLEVLTETVVAPKKWWSNMFDEPYTRWNIVFDIVQREVHFRTVTAPTVRRISLGSFDLSCEAPLLMLNVNARLEGNIDGAFHPYDHDANLEIFRKTCDKLGIEVSKESAVELIGLFESFECGP
jgi:penicillin V acylase-like amidase (Ntn superfamily)